MYVTWKRLSRSLCLSRGLPVNAWAGRKPLSMAALLICLLVAPHPIRGAHTARAADSSTCLCLPAGLSVCVQLGQAEHYDPSDPGVNVFPGRTGWEAGSSQSKAEQ